MPLHFNLFESPLFRRGLLYDWNILLQKRQGIIRTRLDTWRKKSQPPIFLGAKSNSPTVLRSAPWSGTLTVSVTLKQKDKNPIHVPSKSEPQLLTIPIKQSNQLTRLKVLLGMEAATSVITLMVSLISGLSLYYYTEEYVFGSFKTYLSLFTWAAGIDQGRNFVQTLQSYRKP